jgi:hypothetical protein
MRTVIAIDAGMSYRDTLGVQKRGHARPLPYDPRIRIVHANMSMSLQRFWRQWPFHQHREILPLLRKFEDRERGLAEDPLFIGFGAERDMLHGPLQRVAVTLAPGNGWEITSPHDA